MRQDNTFISIATLKAKEHQAEKVKELLLGMIQPSREEAGCLEYILFQDKEIPHVFYMREAFKDQSAFEFHLNTAHFKSLEKNIKELLAEPIHLIKLHRLVD